MAKTRSIGPTPAQKRVLRSIDQLSKRAKELATMLDELSLNLRTLGTQGGGAELARDRQIWIGPWCPPPPPDKKKR